MEQTARNLTDADDGFLNGTPYLIHDRDPLLPGAFKGRCEPSAVKTVKLPVQRSASNAYVERFGRFIKSERPARIIPPGDRPLRRAVREYRERCHFKRNHQGLNEELIEKPSDDPNMDGALECQESLWLSSSTTIGGRRDGGRINGTLRDSLQANETELGRGAMSNRPLEGLRVVDLADEKGELAGRLLADLGADVVRVEPPGGAKSRSIPPFYHDTSLYFSYRNFNKRGITLDLERPRDRDRL